MAKIIVIIVCVILVVLLVGFILDTKVCTGGDLFIRDCGKLLFPWVKRFKLPSGKFCCIDCYMNELQQFTKMRSDVDGLTFKDEVEKEE